MTYLPKIYFVLFFSTANNYLPSWSSSKPNHFYPLSLCQLPTFKRGLISAHFTSKSVSAFCLGLAFYIVNSLGRYKSFILLKPKAGVLAALDRGSASFWSKGTSLLAIIKYPCFLSSGFLFSDATHWAHRCHLRFSMGIGAWGISARKSWYSC